jgi:hypothetical protein
MRRRILWLLLACLLIPPHPQAQAAGPAGPSEAKEGITLVPESERDLHVLILGLAPQDNQYFQLPELQFGKKIPSDLRQRLESEFYGLNFELSQGGIMRCLPPQTQVYLGVPDPLKNPASFGREIPYFMDYLIRHCGWTEGQIRERIHFFKVPSPLIWAQDAGQVLGHDDRGRTVIAVSREDQDFYIGFLSALEQTYPERFRLWWLPGGLSAEGGDENLVLLPDGKIAYALGFHRILFYLKNLYGDDFDGKNPGRSRIDRAKAAYSKGVLGIPVLVLPEKALEHPSLADPQLFHLDMMACFLTHDGAPQAFVPRFEAKPLDMTTGQPLDGQWVEKMRKELQQTADQLQAAGYEVYRLPFADHPVRSPANLCKYYDPKTHTDELLMSRYPYHLRDGESPNPDEQFHKQLAWLADETGLHQREETVRSMEELEDVVGNFWRALLNLEKAPNPLFDRQEALFRSLGYHVVPVPMFPSGAGGIHCMTLH